MATGGRLAGKVALVTGSTRGIGRATALRFAQEGAAVVVTGRSEGDGRAVEGAIRAAGGDAAYVQADLSHEDDVIAMVQAAVDRFGALTTLVNNAAPTELMGPGRRDRRVTELENDAWDAIMLVALKAVVWCCKYAIPRMVESGGGAIVNISSAASLLGTPGLDRGRHARRRSARDDNIGRVSHLQRRFRLENQFRAQTNMAAEQQGWQDYSFRDADPSSHGFFYSSP